MAAPPEPKPRANPQLKIQTALGSGTPGKPWKPDFTIGPDVFSVRYSHDGEVVAVAAVDGGIRVYNVTEAVNRISQKLYVNTRTLPATCVRWRPPVPGIAGKVLLATSSDGAAVRFDLASGRVLNKVFEEGNEIYAGDYRTDGKQFATCGKDFINRVYDEETNACVVQLGGSTYSGSADEARSGHSNRVFSIKWLPGSDFIFLSAGWDDTIQMMDTRMGGSIRSMFGPHVAGDALDLYDNLVVAGSWTPKDQIQMFDLRTAQQLSAISWNPNTGANSPEEQAQVYTLQLSSSGRFIAAGGSGTGEVRIYSTNSKTVWGVIDGLKKPIHSLAFDAAEKRLIAGGAGGNVVVAEM